MSSFGIPVISLHHSTMCDLISIISVFNLPVRLPPNQHSLIPVQAVLCSDKSLSQVTQGWFQGTIYLVMPREFLRNLLQTISCSWQKMLFFRHKIMDRSDNMSWKMSTPLCLWNWWCSTQVVDVVKSAQSCFDVIPSFPRFLCQLFASQFVWGLF